MNDGASADVAAAPVVGTAAGPAVASDVVVIVGGGGGGGVCGDDVAVVAVGVGAIFGVVLADAGALAVDADHVVESTDGVCATDRRASAHTHTHTHTHSAVN